MQITMDSTNTYECGLFGIRLEQPVSARRIAQHILVLGVYKLGERASGYMILSTEGPSV